MGAKPMQPSVFLPRDIGMKGLTLNKFPVTALTLRLHPSIFDTQGRARLCSRLLASETPPLSPVAVSLVCDTPPHADKARRTSRCDSRLIKRSQMDRLSRGRGKKREKAPFAPTNPLTMHTNIFFCLGWVV